MALVYKKQHSDFFFPVLIPEVTPTGPVQHKVDFKFRHFSRSKINELQAESESNADVDDVQAREASLQRDADYILRIASDWRGFQDETGAAMEFTRDNVLAIIDEYPATAGAVVKAFFAASLGGGRKEKNL